MLTKMGVQYHNMSRPIRRILPLIDEAFIKVTGDEAVLTSGTEGDHSPGSLHYDTVDYGAADFRLRQYDMKVRDDIRLAVKRKIIAKYGTRAYDVVFSVNDTVLHVEYDPK